MKIKFTVRPVYKNFGFRDNLAIYFKNKKTARGIVFTQKNALFKNMNWVPILPLLNRCLKRCDPYKQHLLHWISK